MNAFVTSYNNSEILGLTIDEKPHLYWLPLYRALGLSAKHATDIIRRLDEGIHYRKYNRSELQTVLTSITTTVIPAVRSYYFLTDTGWFRAVQEIDTARMLKPDVAKKINRIRDDMASIYAQYNRGEITSITPSRPKEFISAAPVIEDYLKQARLLHTFVGVDLERAASHCLSKAELTLKKFGYPDNLSHLTNLLAGQAVHENAGLTASDIGAHFNLSATVINKVLELAGYQVSHYRNTVSGKRKEWVPTDKGKSFGAYMPVSASLPNESVHTGCRWDCRWLWKDTILKPLRSFIFKDFQTKPGEYHE